MAKKQIDHDSLRHGAKEMREYGRAITEATEKLRVEVTGKNSPWGSDEVGSLFGQLYRPLADLAFAYYRELGIAVGELGDGLDTISRCWMDTEVRQALRLEGIRQRLNEIR